MSDSANIHIDGGSRGNPGEASFAFIIARDNQPPLEEYGRIGKQTNNVAEYTALIHALKKANDLGIATARIHSDSELLVKQMNGEYRVKNADLRPLYEEAQSLASRIGKVELVHVRREMNKRADELCNIALDGGPKPATSNSASKTSKPKTGKFVGDGAVRDDCLECLKSAKACWQRGEPLPTVELLWEQLWSVLEDGHVLRKV
jgi:ribonuclease HI